jgi:drug/metabolite transporter (DMT)-like permease
MHILLYFLAIICLSQAASITRWSGVPPEVIGFWRLFAASLCLFTVSCYLKKFKASSLLKPKDWPAYLLCAAFFSSHLWTYAYAAQNTTIANCLILFSTNPLWVAAGNKLLFKQPLKSRYIISYFLAAVGILILMKNSLDLMSQQNQIGNFIALISGFLYAGYLIVSKKIRLSADNVNFTSLMYFFASLIFAIICFFQNSEVLHLNSQAWLAFLAIIIFPTLMGHAVFTWLMKYLDLNLMACGKLLEPVLAAVIAAIVFSENPDQATYTAFSFTTCALLILFLPELKKKSKLT